MSRYVTAGPLTVASSSTMYLEFDLEAILLWGNFPPTLALVFLYSALHFLICVHTYTHTSPEI